MSSNSHPDPLVGLAINPGLRDKVLPSADELRALGPKWVRYLVTHPFQDFQTGQNTELDLVIDRCRDLDVNVLALINPETLNENPPLDNPEGWGDTNSGYIGKVADLAQKIAAYYQEKIGAIEVWNEPDIQEIVPEDYAALLAAAYDRIKAVSAVPVISAGICCGMNHSYLQRVVAAAPGVCDGVGWHPYGLRVDGYPFPEWGFGELRDSLVRARAIAGKPLWLTEIGADLAYSWQPGVAPEEAVAEYLTRAFALIRELGTDTVAHAFWFTWKIPEAGWGLVDDVGNRRAAWYAFRQQTHPAPAAITQVSLTPTTIERGGLLNVSITVRNNSAEPLSTQGPEPGFVYEEGETFYTRGFPEIPGTFRVGVDFDTRAGIDHPYRWGLSAPLAPGETRTITGAIRLRMARSQNYWAGLVQEQVAWLQDRQGSQSITVKGEPMDKLQIVAVTFSPTSLAAGQLLNVSITVKNNSNESLPTQGPEPGFVYEEGESFYTRNSPEVPGVFRVGVDFDARTGIDHPYRWGLGTPLAPGETRVIAGAIRLRNAQAQNYWAGAVHERVAWLEDRQGTQSITVTGAPVGEPRIIGVTFAPTTLETNQLLNVSITVKNESNAPLPTQGPEPGLVYAEGESFYTRGFPDVNGAFRVGVDFDARTGIDHPYRWGLGTPLAPGETRTIAGAIQLQTVQAKKYWAGLVQEQIAWRQDREGTQQVTVTAPPGEEPRIVAVTFSPTTLAAGEMLNVSITVKNNSSAALPTQGPDPGLVYDEGESFYTRGFPDAVGAFRVGVDFDARMGVDHPYRWGLGAPLAPGETRVVTGAIRLKVPQTRNYWAGLLQERVAWLQQREGIQAVQVTSVIQPRVVHVRDDNATFWNGEEDYWNYVNQDVVNDMVERGVKTLTGASTVADAWRALLPHYQPGQGIAIKVNFANDGALGRIDSLFQTLNAIVRGLKMIGARESDVWVYDAHVIPDYYTQGCQFPGVRFFGNNTFPRVGFDSSDPSAYLALNPPPDVPPMPAIKVSDVLVNATYVINLPIFKGHYGGAGVTLGFKNHLGSTNNPPAFHAYTWPGAVYFRADYNAHVDLYRSPHIRNKTVLTIGDGLFTGDRWNSPPLTMKTFGNQTPNSLFFATDPVAIDCVMYDLLDAEWHIRAGSDNYLRLASVMGLGMFERGDPWGSGYSQIDYQRI